MLDLPTLDYPTQLNKDIQSKDKLLILSITYSVLILSVIGTEANGNGYTEIAYLPFGFVTQ